MSDNKENQKSVANVAFAIELARYWGVCDETVSNAKRLMRERPGMHAHSAFRLGFVISSLSLLPPGINAVTAATCAM